MSGVPDGPYQRATPIGDGHGRAAPPHGRSGLFRDVEVDPRATLGIVTREGALSEIAPPAPLLPVRRGPDVEKVRVRLERLRHVDHGLNVVEDPRATPVRPDDEVVVLALNLDSANRYAREIPADVDPCVPSVP